METVLGMTDLQIKLFTALGQLSIACIVGYIAYQQWQTARRKLKADLFDRRFAAYDELTRLVNNVLYGAQDGASDSAQVGVHTVDELERVAQEMAWLFDQIVANYVKEHIAAAALQVIYANADVVASANKDEGEELTVEASVLHRDLHNNLKAATALIGQYLELEH